MEEGEENIRYTDIAAAYLRTFAKQNSVKKTTSSHCFVLWQLHNTKQFNLDIFFLFNVK